MIAARVVASSASRNVGAPLGHSFMIFAHAGVAGVERRAIGSTIAGHLRIVRSYGRIMLLLTGRIRIILLLRRCRLLAVKRGAIRLCLGCSRLRVSGACKAQA